MASEKPVKMNEKGMITIPAYLRKKYHWQEGTEFVLIELEGRINIIPIAELDALPKMSKEEFRKIYENTHQEELELEK